MTAVKYFNGTKELKNIQPFPMSKFVAMGGVKSKHNYYDSFQALIGVDAAGDLVPVTRKIFRTAYPSMHKCDARCLHAKGHNCECSCGGQFHGSAN